MNSRESRARERGAVSIKTIVILFVLFCAAFLMLKLVPVYVEQRKVIFDVEELARIATVRSFKDERIVPEITKIRSTYELPEGSINLMQRVGPGVQIGVNYTRSVDLLVTTYSWKVEHTVVGKEL
ncbi:MAG TPA: hypothetical protein VJ464_19230 [Blastocatellia bacterium]|nr:hypothetical protein [Blastocatellia bacterium]